VEEPDTPREYTLEVSVRGGGPLDAKRAEVTGLLHVPGLSLLELRRPDGEVVEEPGTHQQLNGGDQLAFSGVLDGILDVLRTPGLVAAQAQLDKLDGHAADRCYVEAVVSRTSPLLARTVKEVRFFELYHAVVLAVARNGQRLRAPLDEVDFRPGDALFLEAGRDFVDKHRNSGDFALASRIDGEGPATSAQAPVAALILLSMVVTVAFGWLPMLTAAALAAAAMLITRCCSEETARASIDWPLVLAIGAAFGLGRALEDTGVAAAVSGALLRSAGDDPLLALAVVYGTTCLLTEFVTNNAAAVIVFPIAYGTAEQLGVNHVPFVAAVMIAASASFVTPIGYQTNLMVYRPGGYQFSDFARVGLPLALLLGAMTVALAPLVYGF
jgi:di/tricarboxylate transporter